MISEAAATMWDADAASRWIGMELVSAHDGEATLTLEVQPHHCNGHGILHGGITFSLADTAFAFACNSRGQPTVAHSNSIHYLAPGHAGDVVRATACEVHLRGRSGLYDVVVTRSDGTVLAQFRGQSRAIAPRKEAP